MDKNQGKMLEVDPKQQGYRTTKKLIHSVVVYLLRQKSRTSAREALPVSFY